MQEELEMCKSEIAIEAIVEITMRNFFLYNELCEKLLVVINRRIHDMHF
jgi:hypothetical protein